MILWVVGEGAEGLYFLIIIILWFECTKNWLERSTGKYIKQNHKACETQSKLPCLLSLKHQSHTPGIKFYIIYLESDILCFFRKLFQYYISWYRLELNIIYLQLFWLAKKKKRNIIWTYYFRKSDCLFRLRGSGTEMRHMSKTALHLLIFRAL